MNKEEQRKKLLAQRGNLASTKRKEKSEIIRKKLFEEQEFQQAQRILIYIDFNNEVRTIDIIKKMLADTKEVIVPITGEEKLYLSELKDLTELKPNDYGILEPKEKYMRLVKEESLDLIVAPGVGFDRSCNRIGYGGGYYDRLLAIVPQVPVIALSFAEQIIDLIETTTHDQKVDKIITEQEIISCK